MWSTRFRALFLISAVMSIIWTAVLIIPFDPFDNLLAVMIGGGAGSWLLIGYLIYLSVGLGGFAGLSFIISSIEDEGRIPNSTAMWVALIGLLAGVNVTCLFLGYAGAYGGYAQSVQHLPGSTLDQILSPFVNVTRLTTLIATVGALAAVIGMAASKRENKPE
jgi:hypothetical protein